MKRWICTFTAVALLCLLSACSFTTNFSDSTGNSKMQTAAKVEEMMTALAGDDMDTALSLMHPEVAGNSEAAIAQMRDYLAGRKMSELNQMGVSVNTSTGTSGQTRREEATFQVIFEDETEVYLSAAYYSDNSGEGFASFQLVLGVV